MRSSPSADCRELFDVTMARTDQSPFPRLGSGSQDRPGSHPAGQAHAERICRELQQQSPRGVPSRQLVSELVRSKTDHRQLAQRLQPKEATQQPELHDAIGVRRKSRPWKRRRPSLLEKRYSRFSLSHRYGYGGLSIICMRKMGSGQNSVLLIVS